MAETVFTNALLHPPEPAPEAISPEDLLILDELSRSAVAMFTGDNPVGYDFGWFRLEQVPKYFLKDPFAY